MIHQAGLDANPPVGYKAGFPPRRGLRARLYLILALIGAVGIGAGFMQVKTGLDADAKAKAAAEHADKVLHLNLVLASHQLTWNYGVAKAGTPERAAREKIFRDWVDSLAADTVEAR